MIIGLTGASGLIGREIIRQATAQGDQVIGFSRTPERPVPGCLETRLFNSHSPPDFSQCDAVIHLAGESIFGVWTASKRRRIAESRVVGTRLVAEGISRAHPAPGVLVSGSAIGFYGDTGENEAGEDFPPGQGFLAELCKNWEREAARAERGSTRVVQLRTAVVLDSSAGALRMMLPIFRARLGSEIGNGRQWMSWITLHDIAALALFATMNEAIAGPLNGAAPGPVRNADFTRQLARCLGCRAVLRLPAFALRLLGSEFSRELLDGKRVVPAKALGSGFKFRDPELGPALYRILKS
jgi:uncharacterized protein (TIGR01777 family)